MPKLAQLLKDRRTLKISLGEGETLVVTYRPGAITPATHDVTMDLVEQQRQPAALAKSLALVIIDWDLIGDDDQPYPVTEEALRALPMSFLSDVFQAIQEDLSPNAAKSEGSGGSF
jgi:hypothetical protein